jgi:DNA-binding winged helix-turn-helix (wHTH) protein
MGTGPYPPMRRGIGELLYLFEDFALDSNRRELRRREELLSVEPQVFDLLEYLIRHRDRVVSRHDLVAAIWQGRIVSEATLSSRINAARTALNDSGEGQRLIRTVLRKGVRFVGAVRMESAAELTAETELANPDWSCRIIRQSPCFRLRT